MRFAVTFAAAVLMLVSPARPELNLYVEKTGLLSGKKHHFVFEKYEVKLDVNAAAPAQSRVQLRIDAGSIVCKDTWVSAKDLNKIRQMALEDMLAVVQYRDITFYSTEIRQVSAASFQVTGMLTVRDVTKPVVVNVKREGGVLSGSAVVKLTDYNLKPPSAALGLVGTKNEMMFSFTLADR
jgi:polyisoprenoid-binding protein YceI